MTGHRHTRPSRTPRHTTLRGTTLGILTATLAGSLQLITATPAAADPTPNAWTQLRDCESGDNYTIIDSGGHYYGAYQFDLTTWHSVGGTGYPNKATPTEQDYRALYLYRMRGWQPWSCARTLHLQPDTDAASHRIPTPIPTTTPTPNPPTAIPPWPGKVYTYGNCDPALRTWQHRMNVYGYHLENTGCYYTKTKTAVLDIQHANHIKPTGQLGPKTWRAAWTGKKPQH